MRVEVNGRYGHFTPAQEMQDMLRYDDGYVVECVELDRTHFRAVVEIKHYTPERWSSFIMRTKVLS